ncbi:hypothetical protein Mal4_13300 [Maioricimonas rarisocia]|uniref:DUF1475 domain-containing protein n=1 Tax=Maioricimonas rarisocia TaxID=2528026 RepID=A0A517Z3L7_9PLAN|nr:DUF1475 family protein [Maioricimonas rarisocia]QDU37027.1 hypothetical protein Mal4_13300 [Maioricimonas rarisocia]
MRVLLTLVFGSFLLVMLSVTVIAMLDRSVFSVGEELTSDPWFIATLVDAYLGFLTFYVWVAYRERRWPARLIWFVLIMCLGNIAMASYVLWQVWRLPAGASMDTLLLRDDRRGRAPATGAAP